MGKVILILFLGLIAGGYFLQQRYVTGIQTIIPFPYTWKEETIAQKEIDAPILIIGDKMGDFLNRFSSLLAEEISRNLTSNIKIQSLAAPHLGAHRTLKTIRSIKKLPKIILFLGGSEEFFEKKYYDRAIEDSLKNFQLYQDERIQTLLMLFPALAPFIYHKIPLIQLSDKIEEKSPAKNDFLFQKRNELTFTLYKHELKEIFQYLQDQKSYLIAITSPINLDIAPKRSCKGTLGPEQKDKLKSIIDLISREDFKQAYPLSKDLTLIANSSSKAHYIAGQVARNLHLLKEARKSLNLAASLDCSNWRSGPVYNAILKDVAAKNRILVYDFQNMLYRNWTKNTLFLDEIYPQNYYMEKMVKTLGQRIKNILKL